MSLDFYIETSVDTGGSELHCVSLYSRNATHNLGPLWRALGVYDALYKNDGRPAGEIVDSLRRGLRLLEDDPTAYARFDAKNGWGTVKDAIPFLQETLEACETHPKATIRISK